MLHLAVATAAETFDQMRDPLARFDIRARHLPSRERLLPLGMPIDEYDVGFVYPPRLMEGGVVEALADIPWVNGPEAVLTSRNKGGVLARLGQVGVPVPDTIMVSNPVSRGELREAFDRIGPPVVVKPNSATRGLGVTKAADLDSFLGIVDYLDALHESPVTGDRSFLVQEYLTEPRDLRVMVIEGTVVGGVERRLPDSAREAGRWKQNVHQDAEAVAIDVSSEISTLAESVASTLDIDFLGVDFLVTDDRAVVTETNARPTIDAPRKYDPDFFERLARVITSRAEGNE